MRFWLGQSASLLGSQITLLALPLTAITVLGASPSEMGLLAAAQGAPVLLVGPLAGVWVDRWPRRPVLLLSNLAQAALIGCIPALWALGVLRMDVLYGVGFLGGVAGAFFWPAYHAYVPALVEREHLVEANTKLEASVFLARVVGPGVGGLLVQVVSAPAALLADAASFLAATILLLGVHAPALPRTGTAPQGLWRDAGAGITAIASIPVLRALVLSESVFMFGAGGFFAVYVLFLARDLGLSPLAIGGVMAIAAPAALLGSLIPGGVVKYLGIGPTLLVAAAVGGAGRVLAPLAAGPVAVPLLACSECLRVGIGPTQNVTAASLRQAVTPDHLRGRTAAVTRSLTWGVAPLGALAAGLVGEAYGARGALLAAALVSAIPPLAILAASPLRTMRGLPQATTLASRAVSSSAR